MSIAELLGRLNEQLKNDEDKDITEKRFSVISRFHNGKLEFH